MRTFPKSPSKKPENNAPSQNYEISEAWNAPHSIILMECQTTCPTENNNWNNSIVSLSLSLNQSTNPPLAIAGYKYES